VSPLLGALGWPVLDRVHLFGGLAISPHGVGIAVGFLFGSWILVHEGPKRGVSVEALNTMLFWALIGTIIGARLFYVIAHYSEFNGIVDMLAVWRGGISLLGGIAGAILINVPYMRKHQIRFFPVMDGAVIGLAFGIAFGRIGDLIIGDHLGVPTSWALAFQYKGGNLSGFDCVAGTCSALLQGGKELVITKTGATLFSAGGEVIGKGVGVHQTALYDMVSATLLFLVLYMLNRRPRRTGVITLTFGAWYGAMRVLEDSLRVDKRFGGLTGSQWTGMTVSVLCLVTLLAWAIASRRRRAGPSIRSGGAEREPVLAEDVGPPPAGSS
jgi:phosphatidylglycerol:prolipoprotein diacylglycerol transferase